MNKSGQESWIPHMRAKNYGIRGYLLILSGFYLAGLPFLTFVLAEIRQSVWFWCLCLIVARLLYIAGEKKLIASRRAQQGADGEQEIANMLMPLPPSWLVQRNITLPGCGDIDFVIRSPEGKFFAIEVKSHRGSVVRRGDRLCRWQNFQCVEFEKNFVVQTLLQAIALRKMLSPNSFVTAILVFSDAKVLLQENRIKHVHILSKEELVQFLLDANHAILQEHSCFYSHTKELSKGRIKEQQLSGLHMRAVNSRAKNL